MVTWNQQYSVGNPLLDEQHKELFSLCLQAADFIDDGSPEGRANFRKILEGLVAYAEKHFKVEEALLSQCHYPYLAEHKAEHVEYQDKLTEFTLDQAFGNLDKVSLYRYLSNWWIKHILESDMQYSSFITDAH